MKCSVTNGVGYCTHHGSCPGCCLTPSAVDLMEQVAPADLSRGPGNPYLVYRGGRYRILFQNAFVDNRAISLGQPVRIPVYN